MEPKFAVGDKVLQKYFAEAPSMVVVNIEADAGMYFCRYQAGDRYELSVFYENELKPGFRETVNQTICIDDYVINKYLAPSPLMRVVKDFDNEMMFGCQYLVNGVFRYAEFRQDDLELVEDDRLDPLERLKERSPKFYYKDPQQIA